MNIKSSRNRVEPGINTPQDGGTVGERPQYDMGATKTEFQTCNLSNPQSCENDLGEKRGRIRGERWRGVRNRANFKLI